MVEIPVERFREDVHFFLSESSIPFVDKLNSRRFGVF